jgi:hypothetical protein
MTDAPLYPLQIGDTLSGHEWCEVRFHRLLGSRWRMVMSREPDAGFFGFLLWFESLRQNPAGTLPDDDDELAALAGLGLDVDRWRDLKARGALYGWGACLVADPGAEELRPRLMHRTVTEVAVGAFARLRERKAASEEGTRRKRRARVQALLPGLGLRSALAKSERFAGRVLDALDADRARITADNVRVAVEKISMQNVVQMTDFTTE